MSRFKTPEVQDNVTPNLIPMIDIMFLLLLFFMLGADMGQRELADLRLTEADKVTEADKERGAEGHTNVNVYHRATGGGFECATQTAGGLCRDDTHWIFDIRAKEYTVASLKEKLQEEADMDLEPEVDKAAGKRLSARKLTIRGDQDAPFGHVQKVIETAGQVGIYKIDVAAALPPKK